MDERRRAGWGIGLAVLVATGAIPQVARAQSSGAAEGASCTASAECSGALMCVHGKCVDKSRRRRSEPPPDAPAVASPAPAAPTVTSPAPVAPTVALPAPAAPTVTSPPPAGLSTRAPAWACVPSDDMACSAATHRVCARDGSGWGGCIAGQPSTPTEHFLSLAMPVDPAIAVWTPRIGLWAFGVTLSVLGSAALVGGAVGVATDPTGQYGTAWEGLIIGGLSGLTLGITLCVVGNHSFKAQYFDTKTARASQPSQTTGWFIAPYASPGGVGAYGSF